MAQKHDQSDWVWIETAEGQRLLYRLLAGGTNRRSDVDWRAYWRKVKVRP